MRNVSKSYDLTTNEVRNKATYAWGNVETIYEIIPDRVWDVGTSGHGGLVARYVGTELPEYAYYTFAGVFSSNDGEHVFALFEEDEDWANLLANDEETRKLIYDHWHVLLSYESFCDVINEQYAMNHWCVEHRGIC